jgi:hypothetical protein
MVNELKLHIFENMFESLAETVKEKFSWIQNIPIPGQSQKKTQTSFPGFLMPDMTQEIPILKKYCGNDDNQIDNYLCTSLSNHLSLAANYSKYKDSPCFFAVFGISSHPKPDSMTEHEICSHINKLMHKKEDVDTIYQTCQDFLHLRNKYLQMSTESPPISKNPN